MLVTAETFRHFVLIVEEFRLPIPFSTFCYPHIITLTAHIFQWKSAVVLQEARLAFGTRYLEKDPMLALDICHKGIILLDAIHVSIAD